MKWSIVFIFIFFSTLSYTKNKNNSLLNNKCDKKYRKYYNNLYFQDMVPFSGPIGELESIILNMRKLTDNDKYIIFKNLYCATSVTTFSISGTIFNNELLKYLPDLKKLKRINIILSNINKIGLSYISNVETLEELDLSINNLNDEAFKNIYNLKKLRYLDLKFSPLITSNVIKYLIRLHKLEELILAFTGVTDQDLLKFKYNKNLKKLVLLNCNVSKEIISRLKQIHPNKKLIVSFGKVSKKSSTYQVYKNVIKNMKKFGLKY